MEDKIVTQVIEEFRRRSQVGIKKYGTTLDQNNTDDFIQHLREELMDAILYLTKIKSERTMKSEKIVKYVLDHKTSYLIKGLNYPVKEEDGKNYYFVFNQQTVKYPKFYFMEIAI
jgi:hypothetical protein